MELVAYQLEQELEYLHLVEVDNLPWRVVQEWDWVPALQKDMECFEVAWH